MFPVIDFETGDLGVFKVDNGVCEDLVYVFVHGEENLEKHGNDNFLQALAKYGLKLYQWESIRNFVFVYLETQGKHLLETVQFPNNKIFYWKWIIRRISPDKWIKG